MGRVSLFLTPSTQKMIMERSNWNRLTALQLGKYAEYYAKMEFTLQGWDVYSPEIDDKGIDFIVKKNRFLIETQVKSVRLEKTKYVFMQKSKFLKHANLFLCLVIFEENKGPNLFLIPSQAWDQPDDLLADMNYGDGKTSAPEYGIRLSGKNMGLLQQYDFNRVISELNNTVDYSNKSLVEAAHLLAKDYACDSELTAFSSLDATEFYEKG